MLPLELSAILSTFSKIPFVIKIFVLSIFECVWAFSVMSLFRFAILCVPSSFAIILLGKRERVALRLLCRCYRPLTFPRGAKGWSVVCDCGIFWSYSLTF